MDRFRRLSRALAIAAFLGLAVAPGLRGALGQAPAAGSPGTTPVPASMDWNQATSDALNLLNAYRAQQTPPAPPLQVDAVLQAAAAWEANDQLTNGTCFIGTPAAPVNPSPMSICPHADSLGRDPVARLAAFGYTAQASENADFGFAQPPPTEKTTGNSVFTFWRDVPDPDANGNPTYAHRMNMINPAWSVIALAQQCDAAMDACFWVADFGSCSMQVFTPPPGSPEPSAPQTAAAPCTNTAATPSLMGPFGRR